MYKNLAAVIAAACFFSLSPSAQAEPLKAGFVFVSPITEAGWTRQHEEGRKAVDKALAAPLKPLMSKTSPKAQMLSA